MAEHVVSRSFMPAWPSTTVPRVARRCACGTHTPGGGTCVQCSAAHDSTEREGRDRHGAVEAPAVLREALSSPGHSLDAATRTFMESSLGHDFSGIRVHTDALASESAQAIGASAYTVGRDVVFGAGSYAPTTTQGRMLLAHELTHAVQQGMSTATGADSLVLGEPGDHSEVEAERVAHSLDVQGMTPGMGTLGGPSLTAAPQGSVQRQLLPTQAQGGGLERLVQRDSQAGSAGTGAGAAALTMRTIKVWFNTFIPMASVSDPFSRCFTGDNRGFSNSIHADSRTHQEIEFDVATLATTIDWKHVGETHKIDCTSGAILKSATAPTSELTNGSVVRSRGGMAVDFEVDASNPLVFGAPAINAEVMFHIDPITRRCWLRGVHDGFPAYEAYVTADGGAGVPVYTYDPRSKGRTAYALSGYSRETASQPAIRF